MEREAKRQYLQDQLEAAEDHTAAIAATVDALDAVLSHTIGVDDRIDFDSLRLPTTYPAFEPPPHLVHGSPEPHRDAYFSSVRARAAALKAARQEYDRRQADALAQAQQRNAQVEEFESAYLRGDVDSIVAYTTMVLERSDYPVDMPQAFRLEYEPESREVVIDYELPDASIIPSTAEVRYVKSKDAFEEKPRRASEIRHRHEKLVASIALRSVHEVFEADGANHVDFVTFSGFVDAVDPATGRSGRTYLVSIRVPRAEFQAIDLARVEPLVCVRKFAVGLRSQVPAPS